MPLPDNYGGAESGAPAVIDKLLADNYKGRRLVETLATLQQDPGFHSSSFALVARKDIPLHIDGHIVHDLSAPPGGSVNDQTKSDAVLTPRGIHLIPSLNVCATFVAGTLFMLTTRPRLGG
ncbi:hypothetical protein PF002_g5698 [Phytophthora fragariae]|uniref:Uncharacterized protein n=1 Tax=Phytophthora fragariae TaxID=53985 RepID=A0A6A4A0F0_9STRA|nr:hypothetical protein PF003_g9627 [Phytophthora fragariae]KAE8944282.1 hypothetical protein PF009_g6027 [Phytophthora fragariae]KAE9151459.1 hypothetical protein PF006_g4250 [Phytophthora fragariae]KAE9248611.1 hypothetical protein PF002_g5698 [Phytophthora fragariae]KAE9321764.1 hypothetical protein PF001_g4744 [Phytophthora fragariae]